jgi:putative ATPase
MDRSEQPDFFDSDAEEAPAHRAEVDRESAPLADRMRPRTLEEVSGLEHLIGEGAILRRAVEKGRLPSLLFWGPPGSGKTTLARVLARELDADFREVSAVESGVKQLREVIDRARVSQSRGRRTILFIDEIHRFNKSQQDAILPAVESGLVVLIGATTENPSFEVNAPLRSRAHVLRLPALTPDKIRALVDRALAEEERGLGGRELELPEEAADAIVRRANGDARIALNLLEAAADALPAGERRISAELIETLARENTILYDRASGRHYVHASALQKSLRGSDPDAAIYWLGKMLAAGEDPRFIARRILVTAAEDVGLADPQALTVAVAAFQALEILGLPEARIPLAEAVLYIATAPKSNSAVRAIDEAMTAISEEGEAHEVPPILRMTGSEKREYRYPHDAPGHFLPDDYLPFELKGRAFYSPTEMGQEADIAKKLEGPMGRKRPRNKS